MFGTGQYIITQSISANAQNRCRESCRLLSTIYNRGDFSKVFSKWHAILEDLPVDVVQVLDKLCCLTSSGSAEPRSY